jgi:hypothetical protein
VNTVQTLASIAALSNTDVTVTARVTSYGVMASFRPTTDDGMTDEVSSSMRESIAAVMADAGYLSMGAFGDDDLGCCTMWMPA